MQTHHLGRRMSFVISAILIVIVALVASSPALAHGGGAPQLTNAAAGPYLLSAWTTPNPATPGELHLTVALARANDDSPEVDAKVNVQAQSGAGVTIAAEATHEGALVPEFYEADLDLPSSGPWQIDIVVQGAEGSGQAGFTLEVREQGLPWLWIGGGAAAAVALAWVGWMLMRARRR